MYLLKQMTGILSFAFFAHEIFESYYFVHILTKEKTKKVILSLQAWCPLKGHTYLSKASTERCRFV